MVFGKKFRYLLGYLTERIWMNVYRLLYLDISRFPFRVIYWTCHLNSVQNTRCWMINVLYQNKISLCWANRVRKTIHGRIWWNLRHVSFVSVWNFLSKRTVMIYGCDKIKYINRHIYKRYKYIYMYIRIITLKQASLELRWTGKQNNL